MGFFVNGGLNFRNFDFFKTIYIQSCIEKNICSLCSIFVPCFVPAVLFLALFCWSPMALFHVLCSGTIQDNIYV